jgi:hypothetical protein
LILDFENVGHNPFHEYRAVASFRMRLEGGLRSAVASKRTMDNHPLF